MNDGQNKHHIPIFQMAVYHTVLPHQDLAVWAIWKFRDNTTTLRKIA
jgi:hypothetical protein